MTESHLPVVGCNHVRRARAMNRKRPGRECQAHVYMTQETFDYLTARAEAEFRSLNGQILYYVMRGIEAERAALTAGKCDD